MQNSGESEFSTSDNKSAPLKLTFWQNFLLTLSGAAGLISLVADGPIWLTLTGGTLAIATLIWIIASSKRRK